MPEPEFVAPVDRIRLPEEERPGTDYPEFYTQPDFAEVPPRPDGPIVCDPPRPDSDPVSREELELALERAKLVADDCAGILRPAIQAMKDGAWVSRRADEFSLELEEQARHAADAGQGKVEIIQNTLNSRFSGDDGGLVLHEPQIPMPMSTMPEAEV